MQKIIFKQSTNFTVFIISDPCNSLKMHRCLPSDGDSGREIRSQCAHRWAQVPLGCWSDTAPSAAGCSDVVVFCNVIKTSLCPCKIVHWWVYRWFIRDGLKMSVYDTTQDWFHGERLFCSPFVHRCISQKNFNFRSQFIKMLTLNVYRQCCVIMTKYEQHVLVTVWRTRTFLWVGVIKSLS